MVSFFIVGLLVCFVGRFVVVICCCLFGGFEVWGFLFWFVFQVFHFGHKILEYFCMWRPEPKCAESQMNVPVISYLLVSPGIGKYFSVSSKRISMHRRDCCHGWDVLLCMMQLCPGRGKNLPLASKFLTQPVMSFSSCSGGSVFFWSVHLEALTLLFYTPWPWKIKALNWRTWQTLVLLL